MRQNTAQVRAFKRAIGLGTIAGLRSLSAPALLSAAANKEDFGLEGTPFAWMELPQAALGLRVLAVGEMIADKTPKIPARTSPIALIGRAGTGALVGAAVFAADDQPLALGAVVGAMAAVVATFAAYKLRTQATDKWHVPNVVAGLIEDSIVAASGKTLLLATDE
ncbi:MAG: DUF4126 family protein [Abitibacteriaceae bacterium]|nr:DUF4126 family protein [Abditibacteriaceae bacterium]MBV9866705.1 DUF4126 family protein [Abditibacteriaceae bacterium]